MRFTPFCVFCNSLALFVAVTAINERVECDFLLQRKGGATNRVLNYGRPASHLDMRMLRVQVVNVCISALCMTRAGSCGSLEGAVGS